MDGLKYTDTLQNHDIEGTEGIAVDWIHRYDESDVVH